MKKVLVLGAVMAILGLGGLGAVMWMGTSSEEPETSQTTKKKTKKTTNSSSEVTVSEDGTVSMGGGSAGASDEEKKKDEASTPRPLNAAELAQQARMKRPFNQHVYNVSSWWGQATRLTMTSDPELSAEIQALSVKLREGTRLEDANLDVPALLDQEEALAQKLKSSSSNAEIQAIVQYITESVAVTRAGGDPTTVVRPTLPGSATPAP